MGAASSSWLPTAVPPLTSGAGGAAQTGGARGGGQALGSAGSGVPPARNPPTVHTMGDGGGKSGGVAMTRAAQSSSQPAAAFQGSGHTLGGAATSGGSSGGGGGMRGLFGGVGGGGGVSSGAGILTDQRAVAEARAAKFSAPNGRKCCGWFWGEDRCIHCGVLSSLKLINRTIHTCTAMAPSSNDDEKETATLLRR